MINELAVHIMRLEPMRVASFHAFSASPEGEAWQKLVAWAEPRGLLNQPQTHRIFGFNNPNPSAGSPNYGYEFWLQLTPDQAPTDVPVKDFGGGLYAVTRFKGSGEAMPQVWQQLSKWCENSPYKFASHQWLEEHISSGDSPDSLELDLCLPIAG